MKYAYVAEGFLNHNTSTSRLSSNNPNAQNFPRSTEDPNDLHYEYGPKKLFTSRFGEDKGVIMQFDYCLAGDTLVELAGGGRMEIKEIVERVQKGEDIHVYSTNPETFETVVSRVERGALTFKNAPTMKLTLDNGETVIATPEHRFMLRDGSYMEAGDLEDGEELGDFWGYAHNPEPETYQDRNKNRRLEINRVERVLEARGRKINRRNWTQYSSPERGVSFGEAVDELVTGGYRNGVVSVVSVEPWEPQDVYCIKVENFSNFALGAGVMSKNSQLELRLAAVFSEDEGLKSAYAQGKDLHIFVASRVFKKPEEQVTKDERTSAKAVGFGQLTG